MYEKTPTGKTRSLGITRLEMGFLAILIIFVGLLAITRYQDLSITVADSMEQGVVMAVRQGVAAYAEKSRYRGSVSPYPSVLDEAKIGAATSQNLFFAYVLQKGIAVEGWTKAGHHEYRAPSGEMFDYDPQTGSFEARRGMSANSMDHSSQTRQTGAGVR